LIMSAILQVRNIQLASATGIIFDPTLAVSNLSSSGLPGPVPAGAGPQSADAPGSSPWFRLPLQLAGDMGWRPDQAVGLMVQVLHAPYVAYDAVPSARMCSTAVDVKAWLDTWCSSFLTFGPLSVYETCVITI
jgi:hypothetical protein